MLRVSDVKLPESDDGFSLAESSTGVSFETLRAHPAQVYGERRQRAKTTVWFGYRVPNG